MSDEPAIRKRGRWEVGGWEVYGRCICTEVHCKLQVVENDDMLRGIKFKSS